MRIFRIVVLAVVAAAAGPALAGEAGSGRVLLQPPKNVIASPINDRFAVRVLGYSTQINNTLRYDNSAGVAGTRIDVEDFLAQSDHDLFGTLDMMFRIGERHRIQADFFQLRRTGENVITSQLRFGDRVYNANDRVTSEMELRKVGLLYTYSLLKKERIELAAGLGVHLLQIQGEVSRPSTFDYEQLDAAGPFATLAARGTWRITDRLSLNVAAQYFDLTPGDVRGAYRDYAADLQWRAWRNMAFGAGYAYTGYLVNSQDEEFLGFYRLIYKGPQAFVRVSF